MASDQHNRFAETLAEIHRRWGSDALRPLSATKVSRAYIPTGVPSLDALLRGGIPCGQAAAFSGVPTSGMTTLALKIIAEAQKQGRATVYIDLARVFDPGYAVRCGVRLDRLLIIRPDDLAQALDMASIVAMEVGAGLMVLDLPGSAALPPIRKLSTPLRRSGSAALFLATDADTVQSIGGVALRLRIENVGWIEQAHDVSGLRARVTILKNHRARPGQQVEFALTLDDPAWAEAA